MQSFTDAFVKFFIKIILLSNNSTPLFNY